MGLKRTSIALAEVTARQLYWRFPGLVQRVQRVLAKRRGEPTAVVTNVASAALVKRIQDAVAA